MTKAQNPKEFLADFIDQAQRAKKCIYLQSMLFEYGRVLAELEPILISKAKEGVDVQIHVDWVSQRYSEGNANIIPPLYGEKRRRMLKVHYETRLLWQRLKAAGVTIKLINPPTFFAKILSIFKRNHKKLYIVDQTAWVGGINLFDKGFLEYIDVMVKFTDPAYVLLLTREFNRINGNRPKNNYRVPLNNGYELLVDAGTVAKSLIYDEAIELIREAKTSITYVSQFVPDGILLNILINKNIPSTFITSHKGHKYFKKFPYKLSYLYFMLRTKNKNNITLLHQNRTVHAKLLIIDGKKAMFGSHNFVYTGGQLGTEEIAIKTTDQKLVKELESFLQTETMKNLK